MGKLCTSHVDRLNGTQRVFMKRRNRLTLCFSKKLENLEAAFGMFAAYYNYCWQTREPGKSGEKRPSAAMMGQRQPGDTALCRSGTLKKVLCPRLPFQQRAEFGRRRFKMVASRDGSGRPNSLL